MKTKKEKNDQKPGRPPFQDDMKLKAFNLPVELIEKIQKAADQEQGAGKGRGNSSLWARNLFERELKKKKRTAAKKG